MKRPLTAALVLGLVNAAIALFALALVEVATPDDFGWYAYAPLDEVLEKDPRFPWHYVVVPLALLLMNVVVVRAYLVRTVHKHKHKHVPHTGHGEGRAAGAAVASAELRRGSC